MMIERIKNEVKSRFEKLGYVATIDETGFVVEQKHISLDWNAAANVQSKMNDIHGEFADSMMAQVIADNIVISYLNERRN